MDGAVLDAANTVVGATITRGVVAESTSCDGVGVADSVRLGGVGVDVGVGVGMATEMLDCVGIGAGDTSADGVLVGAVEMSAGVVKVSVVVVKVPAGVVEASAGVVEVSVSVVAAVVVEVSVGVVEASAIVSSTGVGIAVSGTTEGDEVEVSATIFKSGVSVVVAAGAGEAVAAALPEVDLRTAVLVPRSPLIVVRNPAGRDMMKVRATRSPFRRE